MKKVSIDFYPIGTKVWINDDEGFGIIQGEIVNVICSYTQGDDCFYPEYHLLFRHHKNEEEYHFYNVKPLFMYDTEENLRKDKRFKLQKKSYNILVRQINSLVMLDNHLNYQGVISKIRVEIDDFISVIYSMQSTVSDKSIDNLVESNFIPLNIT